MTKSSMRLSLMESAVKVVAREGLDRATTKAIAADANLNEVYIYRTFEDKYDLLRNTFFCLDDELLSCILAILEKTDPAEMGMREQWWFVFQNIWEHIISDQDKCLFFVRLYYSHYCDFYVNNERREKYSKVIEKMKPAFQSGTDLWLMLSYMLDVMFSSAVKYIRGENVDDNWTVENVFRLIYAAMEPQLSWTKKSA